MQTGRSVVYAKNGGAAASQPLAVSAAISILKQGGSFIDAAIALSAVICVVEPGASHLGGDAFLVTHHLTAVAKAHMRLHQMLIKMESHCMVLSPQPCQVWYLPGLKHILVTASYL